MIAIPAIDLREGACVQLVGGEYDNEQVRIDNPIEVARSWAQAGFQRLHIVDLDAATSRGSNEAVIRDLLADTAMPTQVGGGVRSVDVIERLVAEGASWVVAGTKALEDPDWLEEVAAIFPGRIIVAADVRGRKIVTRGWGRTLHLDVLEVVERLNLLDLAGIMVTAVHVEGQMKGADLTLMEDVVESSRLPVIASGGVAGMNDLRALDECGVSATVIGMALYTGALDARVVAEEFGQ